nr:hypothetical protein [Chloroflexota bacterium]
MRSWLSGRFQDPMRLATEGELGAFEVALRTAVGEITYEPLPREVLQVSAAQGIGRQRGSLLRPLRLIVVSVAAAAALIVAVALWPIPFLPRSGSAGAA